MKMNHPRNIRGVVSYKRAFNDLNDTHLKAAQAIGIAPIADREAAEHMTRKLSLVETCELYKLDSLTHSIPYLVPKANTLLDNVGKNFLDSLANKGLNPYKVIVTSAPMPMSSACVVETSMPRTSRHTAMAQPSTSATNDSTKCPTPTDTPCNR